MSARFEVVETGAGGAVLLARRLVGDERGSFSRLFDAEDFRELLWPAAVAQVNLSGTTAKGTLRGLHYQSPPFAEAKLVTCISGAIFDVALDLRPGSPTYLAHFSAELSADNGRSLLIPEGFAHGFQTLTDDVRMVYVHSAPYAPHAEGGVDALDPRLAIAWPLPVTLISERDRNLPQISALDQGATP